MTFKKIPSQYLFLLFFFLTLSKCLTYRRASSDQQVQDIIRHTIIFSKTNMRNSLRLHTSWTTKAGYMLIRRHLPITLNQSYKTRLACFFWHLQAACVWLCVIEWRLGMGIVTQACGVKIKFQIGRTCVCLLFFFHNGNTAPEQACTCDNVLHDARYVVTQSTTPGNAAFGCISTTDVTKSTDLLED